MNIDAPESVLEAIVADWESFSVQTAGLGVFPGDHVWIPVARSAFDQTRTRPFERVASSEF